jgi:hypothetical protein
MFSYNLEFRGLNFRSTFSEIFNYEATKGALCMEVKSSIGVLASVVEIYYNYNLFTTTLIKCNICMVFDF